MKFIRTLGLLLAIAAAFAAGYIYKAVKCAAVEAVQKPGRKVLYWVDPMHPAYKSDKPGVAPDCGMQLEPVYADSGPGSSTMPQGTALYYRDPKDPAYKSQHPGLNPATGNELEPVYAGDASTMPAGIVQITPEKQQLIGVKYGEVEMTSGSRTIRGVGRVAIDETRIEHVHTKLDGWIDKVFVNFTGALVKKGDPLLTIYSPDMLASQRELLLAAKTRTMLQNNPLPAAYEQSESLLQAARRRLELWDLSEAQISQVLQTRQPIKNITLYSPVSGYVTERKAFPQLKVSPESDLYTIVNLSRVWVIADIFEYEAPEIHVGETARVSLQALPGRIFNTRIDYLQPQVDPTTRTLKVRLNLDNPGGMFKPDMYADVEIRVNSATRLTVPAEAVLDSGEHKTVFIDRGNGFFEPRKVKTGERVGDRVEILSGLHQGERVVTSGNFLIDSESQMKAATEGMGEAAGIPGAPGSVANPSRQNAGEPVAKGIQRRRESGAQ